MTNSSQEKDIVLETLTQLALGDLSLDGAASVLETTIDDLAELIEASPYLVEQADSRANMMRLDPTRTIERSHRGLASAVDHLSNRLESEGAQMAVSELVQASKVLESLIAFSKSREAELKCDKTKAEDSLPLLIQDRRQQGKVRLFMVPPTSPQWVNTSLPEYQKPQFDWLETFAPINGEGEILSLGPLLDGHTRIMLDTGLVLGGCNGVA